MNTEVDLPETADCEHCGATAYATEPFEDGDATTTYLFCPDCGAQTAILVHDGDLHQQEWKSGSADAAREFLRDHGVAFDADDDEPDANVLTPEAGREWFTDRLRDADLRVERFIDVLDGTKGTRTPGHQDPENWLGPHDDRLSGNYGIHPGFGLLEIDVDDYDGNGDTEPVDDLPTTASVISPHTDPTKPGHRYYVIDDDDARSVLLKYAGTLNPDLSWGEIKYQGKYVVGPGSQLDGCSKEWCDECAKPDGGYYRIGNDEPIAELDPDDLAAILQADPDVSGEQPNATDVFDVDDKGDDNSNGGADVPEDGEINDEWMGPADLRDALHHIDPDVGNDEWVRVGFGLGEWFGRDGTEGDLDDAKELFTEWSQGEIASWHTDDGWDRKAKPRVPNIIEQGANTARDDTGRVVTCGTLIAMARSGDYDDRGDGWDMSKCPSAEAGRIQHRLDDSKDDTASEAAAVAGSESSNGDEDGGGERDDDDGEKEIIGFGEKNGGYGKGERKRSGDGGTYYEWDQWTNFTIDVNSFLKLPDGRTQIDMTVNPRAEDAYDVTVDPTVFNEVREFKSEVAIGRTTTVTAGNDELATIKEFVGTRDAPERKGVTHMGIYDDTLVLPTGTLTPDGWADDPEYQYIERGLGIERKVNLTPSCGSDYDREAVQEIIKLLPASRTNERFLPILGWFYATTLKSFVFNQEDEYPILSITGGTGTGKTSTLETMWAVFGLDTDPLSAKDTPFVMTTTLAASKDLPVWYDEYKPAEFRPGRAESFHDLVRKSTRGTIESRGNPDQTTTDYHLRAPIVVSGEQRFAGPAEQRRSILTTLRSTPTEPESDTAHAHAQLRGGSFRTENQHVIHYDGHDLREHALAYYQWLLDTLQSGEDEIEDMWETAEERVHTVLDAHGLGGVDSAGRTALQTVAFGIALYREFAEAMDTVAPIRDEDRDDALVYIARQQVGGDDGGRESHLDRFIRHLSLTAYEYELEEDEHYTHMFNRNVGEELRVNMSKSYPKVRQYVTQHGIADADTFDEGDYRERIKEGVDDPDSYITCYSQPSNPIGRAFGIHIERASEAIDGFDKNHFSMTRSLIVSTCWRASSDDLLP